MAQIILALSNPGLLNLGLSAQGLNPVSLLPGGGGVEWGGGDKTVTNF